MKFLASASCDEALTHSGRLVLPAEDGKKPHKVTLNVIAEDESVFQKVSGNEEFITFKGYIPKFVPTSFEGKVFYETSLEEVENNKSAFCRGLTPLVRLDTDFCDMRRLYNCSQANPSVRYIGGNLLSIPGIKIGRFDSDKKPVVCNGVYDDFIEVNLSDLNNIQEIVKKVKVKIVDGEEVVSKRRKGDKKPKEKKVNKRVSAFGSMFGSESVDF